MAIGYFDMIDIVNAKETQDEKQKDRGEHPFSQAYLGLPRHEQANTTEEFTMQELILFTDIEEKENSKERIDQFWEDDSLLMYISLIHVDNESDIDKIIVRIQEEFKGQQYLYYFSFDYSGIVLLAKIWKLRHIRQLSFV